MGQGLAGNSGLPAANPGEGRDLNRSATHRQLLGLRQVNHPRRTTPHLWHGRSVYQAVGGATVCTFCSHRPAQHLWALRCDVPAQGKGLNASF